MNKLLFVPIVSFCVAAAAHATEKVEQWGPKNVEGGKKTCARNTDSEIKKSETFEAPPGRYFKNFQVKIISGWAPKAHSCSILEVVEKEIRVETTMGYDDTLRVPYKYIVFAYAACGSDPTVAGKTIAIECEATGEMVKYSNN